MVKPWCIHTMMYYSAIKRNSSWMDLKGIRLSEKSNLKDHRLCGSVYIPRKMTKLHIKMESRLVFAYVKMLESSREGVSIQE